MEILLFLFGIALYFIPTFVASGKRNTGAIFLLNLFLGWTFIGWVAALVWAATDEAPRPPIVPRSYSQPSNSKPSSTTVDQIERLVSLRNTGSISQEEYDRQKQKILNS